MHNFSTTTYADRVAAGAGILEGAKNEQICIAIMRSVGTEYFAKFLFIGEKEDYELILNKFNSFCDLIELKKNNKWRCCVAKIIELAIKNVGKKEVSKFEDCEYEDKPFLLSFQDGKFSGF